MALGTCLPDLLAKGLISQSKHDEMRPLYDELVAQYEPRFGRAAAEAMATEKAVAAMEGDLARRKRLQFLQARAQGAAMANIQRNTAEGAPLNPRAAQALLAPDGKMRMQNVEGLQRALRGQAHSLMEGVLMKHRRNIVGEVRFKEDLDRLGAEAYGEASNDANSRELNEAWQRTAEFLRSQYNAAGGDIAKAARWGLPQTHDARAIRAAGYEAWRNDMVGTDTAPGWLDRSRMIDRQTGEPMSNARLEVLLRDVFETLSTDGWNKRDPGTMGRGALANRRGDPRVLQFRDYAAWKGYAARYGRNTNAFDAMMAHIDGMTRDIAAMRVLGPNPDATIRLLQDELTASAMKSGDEKAIRNKEASANQLRRLYDTYTGAALRPEKERVALWFGTFKAQQVAAKLGSAMLSTPSDFGSFMLTAGYNGLPIMEGLGRYVKLLNPRNEGDRRLAMRLGLVAEEYASRSAASHRYTGEEFGHEISKRLADGVMRASYLAAHTQHLRWAFGMEALSHVAENAELPYGQLNKPFRDMLQRYGIGAEKWDAIRSTPMRDERGSQWIMPEDIGDRDAAERLMEGILTETDLAVPVPDIRTRSLMAHVAKPGTWIGEIVRSGLLFKSFPLSILMLHGRRMMDQTGAWNKVAYGLMTMMLLSAGGALAIQLKQLANGKDPRPMGTKEFMGAAALQGGGLGIFGDLLASDENRFGGGLGATLTGPGVQTVSNLKKLTVDNVRDLALGEETSFGPDTVRLLRQEVPGANLWETRLLYDRMFIDMVQHYLDPDYADSYKRMEKRAAEQGAGYWAPPGAALSDWRAPDLGNAFSGGDAAPAQIAR